MGSASLRSIPKSRCRIRRTVIDLGDVTLLPGLMDMELNLLIGGPGGPEGLPSPMHGVQDDPAYRTLRGAVNARTTLDAGLHHRPQSRD